MSSIEERLARDIAAVTQGVVVTESNLRDARDVMDERIDSRRRRDRRRTVIAAVSAAVLIPVLGFAAFQTLGGDDKTAPPVDQPTPSDFEVDVPTGRAPTPQLLEGIWREDNGGTSLRFTADGHIQIDDTGRLLSDPAAVGDYVIDGDLITVSLSDGREGCAGEQFAMRASVTEPGLVWLTYTQTQPGNCTPQLYDSWVLEQMLPTTDSWAEFSLSQERGWQPPAGERRLHGLWLAEGGGHVLELAPGGDYYIAAGSGEEVDRGRWTLSSSPSRLSLVSSSDSPTCDQGDRFVLGGVEQVDPGTTGMGGTVEQNTCGGAWAATNWILIPHESS